MDNTDEASQLYFLLERDFIMNLKYYLRGLGIGIIVSVIIMFVISLKSDNNMTDDEIRQRARELGMVEASETLASITNNGIIPEDDSVNNTQTDNSAPVDADNAETTENNIVNIEAPENEFLDGVEQQLDEADQQLEEIRNKDNSPDDSSNNAQNESVEESDKKNKDETAVEEKVEDKSAETKQEDDDENIEEKPVEEISENQSSTDESAINITENRQNNKDVVVLTVNRGDNSFEICKKLQALGVVENAKNYDSYLCSVGLDRFIYAGEYSIPKGSSDEEIAFLLTGKRR